MSLGSEILDAAGSLEPRNVFNRYQFVLQSFGMDKVRAMIYEPGKELQPAKNNNSYTTKAIDSPDYNMHTGEQGKQMLSALGTPVFCDLKLKGENEADSTALQLIWVLVEVTIQKNIVKTSIQGRNGTVKEYINLGDYDVKIKGALSNTFSRAYPKDNVQKLIALLQRNTALDVTSEYLQMFGIHSLVVETAPFTQVSGEVNVQKFEINCVSDEPLILKRKK